MKIRKSGFLLYGLLLAAVIVAGRMIFHAVPFYEMMVKTYAGWLGNATASCLGILGYSAIYEAATAKLVIAGGKEIDFLHQLALKFYVFMFVLLLPFTKKKLQTGLFLSMGILILFATAVLRNVALVIAEGQIIDLVMALSYLVRYSLLWLAIVYRVRLHPDLMQLYEKANLRFKERFQLSLSALAFLVLISGSMMSLIDRFIIQSESLLAIVMSNIILSLSETLLHFLHYQPIIDGNYIWLGNVWV